MTMASSGVFECPSWATPPLPNARLEVENGDGKIISIIKLYSRSATTVGRIPDLVDFCLDDHKTISRVHAAFIFGRPPPEESSKTGLCCIDLGSANGTFKRSVSTDNFERIRSGKQAWLEDRDIIRLGESSLNLVVRGLLSATDHDDSTRKRSAFTSFRETHREGEKMPRTGVKVTGCDLSGDGQGSAGGKRSELHWVAAAATLGDEKKSSKFLRLLGAKKAGVAVDPVSVGDDATSRDLSKQQQQLKSALETEYQSARYYGGRTGLGR